MVTGWLARNWKIKTNPKIAILKEEIYEIGHAKGLTLRFRKVKGHLNVSKNNMVDAQARLQAKLAKDGV